MQELSTVFKNNDEAAHAVYRYLNEMRPSPNRFTLRPYNFYSPEFTDWWLIASSEWPAYHLSKLFMSQFPQWGAGTKWFHVGFYVERGLSVELTGMHGVSPSLIMQSNWSWHRFLSHAISGDTTPIVAEVSERSGCPVWLTIDVNEFNHVRTAESETQIPHDWVEFTVLPQGGGLHLERAGARELREVNTCASIREVALRLETIDLRYFWLNLQIGIRLRYDIKNGDSWGASKIWSNALKPWSSWVV